MDVKEKLTSLGHLLKVFLQIFGDISILFWQIFIIVNRLILKK